MRSLVHDHLNMKASISYVPYQDLENRQMLMGFLESPGRWVDHIRRYTNALTTQMVFGFRTVSIDDENMHTLFKVRLCYLFLREVSSREWEMCTDAVIVRGGLGYDVWNCSSAAAGHLPCAAAFTRLPCACEKEG